MKSRTFHLLLIVGAAFCLSNAHAQSPAAIPPLNSTIFASQSSTDPVDPLPPDDVDPDNYRSITSPLAQKKDKDRDKFVTCMHEDSLGQIWIGTEGNGIWRYTPTSSRKGLIKGFSTSAGLGDNKIYAIASDNLGRIWAGHLNHGLSVFNGETWRNYDIGTGLSGDRVYAIALEPHTGDIWIATNAGLTRYSEHTHHWSNFSIVTGFPTNELRALAFDSAATLFVGTAHDGIVIAHPADDYQSWQIIRAASEPADIGLPSNLINQLYIAHNDTIYVATPYGLALSLDHGQHWLNSRTTGWTFPAEKYAAATSSLAPLTDYITCFAEDADHHIWIGTQQNIQLFEPENRRILPADNQYLRFEDHIVSAILASQTGTLVVGQYGGGVTLSPLTSDFHPLNIPADTPITPPFPPENSPPSTDELTKLLGTLTHVPPSTSDSPNLVAMTTDWTTQGAWLGRYGRYWSCLAAFVSPEDFLWGPATTPVNYYVQLGLQHDKSDDVRSWVGINHLKDWRSLELPIPYLQNRISKDLTTWDVNRRQAGWDDHGEIHPLTDAGPDLVCTLRVPPGNFQLALYFVNFDAQDAAIYNNARRDLLVSIRRQPSANRIDDIAEFEQWPQLAQTRIDSFYGGVYARYWVHGPTSLAIHIAKNRSFNTMLNAIMLDPTEEYPAPYYDESTRNAAALAKNSIGPANSPDGLADQAFAALQSLQQSNPAWYVKNATYYYEPLIRWYENVLAQKNSSDSRTEALTFRLATCYFNMGLYYRAEQEQHVLGILTSRDIERGLRWDGRSGPTPDECKQLITGYRLAHLDSLKAAQ